MTGIYLLDVEAWTGSAVETLRLSTQTLATRPSDTPANVVYDGRISDAGSLQRSLFADGGVTGGPAASSGLVELANADGRLDAWLGYGFDGRPFTLRYLADRRAPVASATLVTRGTVARIDTSDATRLMRLQIRDRLASLVRPLLTARYAGTTTGPGPTAEGDSDLKDQIKPLVLGAVANMTPKLANRFNLIYQVSVGPVAAIVAYDGAVPLVSAGDFPSIAALLAATLAPGFFATCLSLGLFRLGGSPAMSITTDVVEGGTLALRSASAVASRILDRMQVPAGERNAASFAAAQAFNPAEVGIHVEGEATALDCLGRVLDSIGAGLLPGSDGTLALYCLGAPAGPALRTYTRRDLIASGSSLALVGGTEQDGEGIPAWSVALSYARISTTMGNGDVAGSVSVERKDYLARPTRQATAQNPATRTARLLASEIAIETLLTRQADAEVEAARRLAIFGVRRDRLVFPVPASRAADIGAVVKVQMRRFGYDAGRLFVVTGRTDDFRKRVATLELWG